MKADTFVQTLLNRASEGPAMKLFIDLGRGYMWFICGNFLELHTYDLYHFLYVCCTSKIILWKHYRDSPGGLLVKNPPSNAGDAGSIPGQGTKIPHAMGAPKPKRCN